MKHVVSYSIVFALLQEVLADNIVLSPKNIEPPINASHNKLAFCIVMVILKIALKRRKEEIIIMNYI